MERRTRYRGISNSPYIEYHAIDPNGRENSFISILQYPTRCKMQLVGYKSDGFTARSFSKKFLNNWYSHAYAYANRMRFIWFFSMTSYMTIHDRAAKYLTNTWHAWSCNINRNLDVIKMADSRGNIMIIYRLISK